jgi:hypothetical protein
MAFLLLSSPHEISKIAFGYQDVRFGTGGEVVRYRWGSGSVSVGKWFGIGGEAVRYQWGRE